MEMDGEKYYSEANGTYPHHHKIFGNLNASYRDFTRHSIGQYGTCYRYEQSENCLD